MLKTKFQRIHLFLALLVLCGIYFLIPDFSIENTYTKAVALGVFSALCYALRNILLKSKVGAYNGSMLMTYQVGMVSIVLLPSPFLGRTSSGLCTMARTVGLGLFDHRCWAYLISK